MAPKAHRSAPGLTRHSRTTSGGTSKVGLNLHFTQKDSVTLQGLKKAKGNAHGRHDSVYPTRTNSDIHIPSKACAGQQTQTSRVVSHPTQRPHGGKKPDFTIASEGDDDEWISSESGPVTPNNLSDDEALTSPAEPPTPVDFSSLISTLPIDQVPMKGNRNEVAVTPRAGLPPIHHHHHPSPPCPEPPATPPARAVPVAQISQITTISLDKPQFEKTEFPARFGSNRNLNRDQSMIEVQTIPGKQLTTKQILSEASPPLSPRRHSRTNSTRQSSTRPPSLHSINAKSDVSLRPHPLIRGHSFGLGTPTAPRPSPLAPLTTISSKDTLGMGNLSSSPPVASPGLSQRSVSPPSSLRTPAAAQDDHTSSEARKQLRRQSTSSQTSIATISTAPQKSAHDRERTASNMSTSSSFLSSFTLPHHHNSPIRSPTTGFISTFPPGDETNDASELIHSLLPPPYLSAHLTVLAHRNSIRESYERVIRAKRQLR